MQRSPEHLQALFDWLTARQAAPCHRQLLVIHGEMEWTRDTARNIVDAHDNDYIWVTTGSSDSRQVSQSQYKDYLGQECDIVVFDGFSGIQPNALAGFSGLIRHSGLLVLLVPDLSSWPAKALENEDLPLSYGVEPTGNSSHFIRWLMHTFVTDSDVAIVSQQKQHLPVSLAQVTEQHLSPPYRTADQAQTTAHLIDTLSSNKRCATLLIAERGRGKSYTLGLTACLLVREHNIVLTAPSKDAVQPIFAAMSAEQHKQVDNGDSQAERIQFVAPDALMEHCQSANTDDNDSILMVDEAAALSQRELRCLSQHYSKIVFSTTSVGYEGSGRGFTVKFSQYLRDHFSRCENLTLKTPIRWHQNDSLERVLNNAFLLTSRQPSVDSNTERHTDIKILSPEDLLAAPALLIQCFGLLIDAHYQTSPDDLRRILDSPDHILIVAVQNGHVVGVALGVIEGNQALDELAEQIASGERRPRGHLSLQSIAMELADPDIVRLRAFRIVRIAVADSSRRQGIASRLCEFAGIYAQQRNIPMLTSSFGLQSSLLTFWNKADFQSVKLGLKRDNASGEHSVLVMRVLDPNLQCVVDKLKVLCRANLLHHSTSHLQDIEPRALLNLIHEVSDSKQLDTVRIARLTHAACGNRAIDSIKTDIQQLLITRPADCKDEDMDLLCAFAIQQWSKSRLIRHFQLSGKKQLSTVVQKAIGMLLEKIKAP